MLDFLLDLFFGSNRGEDIEGHYCQGCDTHYGGTNSFIYNHKPDCSSERTEKKRREAAVKAWCEGNGASPPPSLW